MTAPARDTMREDGAPGDHPLARRHRVLIVLGALLLMAGTCWVTAAVTTRSRVTTSTATAATASPGPVDVGFCQDMTAHHTQALLMADDVLTRGGGSQVRSIALGILAGQSQESGTMRGWLAVWGKPQLPSGPPMTWMHQHTAAGTHASMGASMHSSMGARMPGMAGQAELDRLAGASGRSRDVQFLQLMIRHHQGGIVMASVAAAHAHSALVRSAAAEMVAEQTNENQVMLGLLHRLGGRPLPLD